MALSRSERWRRKRLQQCEETLVRPELIAGYLRFYNLIDWWQTCVSDTEKKLFFEHESTHLADNYHYFSFSSSRQEWSSTANAWLTIEPSGEPVGLVVGEVIRDERPDFVYMSDLARWFNFPQSRPISWLLIRKALALMSGSPRSRQEIISRHFVLQHAIEIFYGGRDERPDALLAAIRACECMIDLSPQAAGAFIRESGSALPSHKGYEQLAIILFKQGL